MLKAQFACNLALRQKGLGHQEHLEWFTYFFCPAIENYCAQNNLTKKTLLILDNVPYHPVNLNDLSDNVRVEYLHDNIADMG